MRDRRIAFCRAAHSVSRSYIKELYFIRRQLTEGVLVAIAATAIQFRHGDHKRWHLLHWH